MNIKVEFSTDGLFGNADTDEIDVPTSISQFTDALVNHLYAEYPKAEIEVKQGISDFQEVDGQRDHEEVPWVEQIIEKVWTGDDWLTYK